MQLQTIVVPPASGRVAEGLIVILHGWGANAQDVLGLASFINLPNFQMVFPDAPFVHPHAPGGRMWYDFTPEFNFQSTPGFYNRPDLTTSRQSLTHLLNSLPEQTGIPLSHTVLGGFSQGGAMTLDVGLNFPLAGLMVLSGYLHAPLQPKATSFPPVLMVHGRQDIVVPLAAARQARESLNALGVDLRYQEFDMGHEIQPLVLEQMRNFIKEVFSRKK
ncbi:MAG: alpha/beta hydrolase [Leptolyngbyaceae cyanobacterium HOT.MB2.61]|nr:alpha/beta hydrolase [Leptolyngbyaceae cyanobacterium HOT.MB2.61]